VRQNTWTVFTVAAAALCGLGAMLLVLAMEWGLGWRQLVLPSLLVLIGALFIRTGLQARRIGAPERRAWSPAVSAVLVACLWELALLLHLA